MTPQSPVAPADRDPNLVFVGVPAIGDPTWGLARTLAQLEIAPNPYGLKFVVRKVGGQGQAKGRNILTYLARCSGARAMILVDSDMPAIPEHFFELLRHPEPFLGALYPKKEIPLAWVGEFNKVPDPKDVHPRGLWPMVSIGAGLVKLTMDCVDQLCSAVSSYESDEEQPILGLEKNQRMHDVFGMGVVREDAFGEGRERDCYLTEDYHASWVWRSELGGKLWLDPNCQIGHIGAIDYLKLHEYVEEQKEMAAHMAVEKWIAEHPGTPITVRGLGE